MFWTGRLISVSDLNDPKICLSSPMQLAEGPSWSFRHLDLTQSAM